MLRVNSPRQNKFSQSRMFVCMTNDAQHLDICWISTQVGFRAVRFYMMPLQRICTTAFFAIAFFCHNLLYYFSNCISSFRRAVVPFWMVWTAHVASTRSSQARNRAICAGATAPFAHLKCFATFFANTINKSFWFAWFKFVGTRPGAGVCFSSDMCVGANKLTTASAASKCYMPTSFNLSLES